MTTLTPPAPPTAPAARGAGPLRRYRTAILLAAALVIAVVFAVLGGGARHSGWRDPQNPDPQGAQAVAQVLADQGIEVEVVRNADAFDRARTGTGTTVVITSAENLGPSTARRVEDHLDGADLVVLDPPFGAARFFGVSDTSPLRERVRTDASCSDPRFTGLRIDVEDPTAYPQASGSCFPTSAGPLLVQPRPHLLLLGSTDLISNEHVTRAGNAAVALRLLGQHDHLVWYVPDAGDVAAGDGVRLGTLLPDFLRPALTLGAVALAGLALWRGRRLGRLAVEPLPVWITAIESTRSRGRLYRKVNDRAYAATALRAAARRRLAEQLGLSRRAADEVPGLVRDLAPHTAVPPARLHALLDPDGPQPGSDHDLIDLANALADLMREVRER